MQLICICLHSLHASFCNKGTISYLFNGRFRSDKWISVIFLVQSFCLLITLLHLPLTVCACTIKNAIAKWHTRKIFTVYAICAALYITSLYYRYQTQATPVAAVAPPFPYLPPLWLQNQAFVNGFWRLWHHRFRICHHCGC